MENNNSIRDLYKLIMEIKNDVGEMKGILKGLPCIDHTKRLNEIEKEVDQLVGKSVIIGSIFGLIGGFVLAVISWFLKNK